MPWRRSPLNPFNTHRATQERNDASLTDPRIKADHVSFARPDVRRRVGASQTDRRLRQGYPRRAKERRDREADRPVVPRNECRLRPAADRRRLRGWRDPLLREEPWLSPLACWRLRL